MLAGLDGNRASETISDDIGDESVRMSDMSNMTLGNQMASISG